MFKSEYDHVSFLHQNILKKVLDLSKTICQQLVYLQNMSWFQNMHTGM